MWRILIDRKHCKKLKPSKILRRRLQLNWKSVTEWTMIGSKTCCLKLHFLAVPPCGWFVELSDFLRTYLFFKILLSLWINNINYLFVKLSDLKIGQNKDSYKYNHGMNQCQNIRSLAASHVNWSAAWNDGHFSRRFL